MKIVIIQADIKLAHLEKNGTGDRRDIRYNLAHMSELLDRVCAADIYVLPEMFSTAFITEPHGLVDDEGLSLAWMKEVARQKDAAVAGSVAIIEGEKYLNRFYFVYPDGHEEHYDKRHLFSYGHEDRHYLPGTTRKVVNWRGVRILLQVCYDLRFPVWSRNRGDYDMAIYVASWPTSRRLSWDVLLRARAIENQCFVVGANRVGADEQCLYDGGSAIIDAYGNALATATEGKECCVVATIDMEWLRNYWKKFPVLKDADPFMLSNDTTRPAAIGCEP